MTIKGSPGWSFGAVAASGTIKEVLGTFEDPKDLEVHLQAAVPGRSITNLQLLQSVLTGLDISDNLAYVHPSQEVALVVRDVIQALESPEAYINLLAKLLNSTPQRLANLVSDRLVEGAEQVDREAFVAQTANLAPQRKELSVNEAESLDNLADSLKALGIKDTDKLVGAFIERYEKLTGTTVVYEPKSFVNLCKQHGDHVRAHLHRPVRLAILPNEEVKGEAVNQFEGFMDQMMVELDRHGLLANTSVLGGFTTNGLNGATYRVAERHTDIERGGIMDATGVLQPVAQVDRGTIFGQEEGGSEAVFSDIAATSMLISVQPNKEEQKRIKEHCKRGGVAIIAGDRPIKKLEVPGVLQLELDADPKETAQMAAQYVRAKSETMRQQSFVSAAEHMSMSKPPSEINEVRQWARQESCRYRLLRLQNAMLAKLSTAHPKASNNQLTSWSLDFARNLISNTHGIDNFEDNQRWQAAANRAIKDSGPEVAEVAPQMSLDVMFNSWFGIREFKAQPSYFDKHARRMEFPDRLDHLNEDCEHTFDKDTYAEVRLDYVTTQFLKAKDSEPEIFLGSREEMQLFYRSRDYEFDCTTHDSNGTEFHYFRSTKPEQPSVMVMHGVDSEARLLQLGALMKVNGVDPKRCVVRGEIDRVRECNRSLLEHRIMEIVAGGDQEKQIAGVIIGNKNEPLEALAEAVGVEPSDLDAKEYRAGPFRFRAVEVTPVGSKVPQVLIAAAPAYGELSYDLVQATAHLGAQNFMLGGAGGSLYSKDQINAVHQITEALCGKERISLVDKPGVKRAQFLEMIKTPEKLARLAENFFSPTPLEQDKKWLIAMQQVMKKLGMDVANVDQETFQVFRGLFDVSMSLNGLQRDGQPLAEGCEVASPKKLFLQPTLVQSDVVGKGALATSTVDNKYGKRIKATTNNYVRQLGIGAVATKGGLKAIKGAKRGLLEGTTPKKARKGVNRVDDLMPNMSTMTTSWLDSAQQFKGEKVPLVIRGERFGPKEEAFLEKLLSGQVNPADVWIVVDAADPHNEEIRESAKRYDGALAPKSDKIRAMARKYGFDTVLVSLESDKTDIKGDFDFLLNYTKERREKPKPGEKPKGPPGKLDFLDELLRQGNADEDPNYAIGRAIILGGEAPPAHERRDPPKGATQADADRFVDLLSLVHEEIAGDEKAPDKKAEKLVKSEPRIIEMMARRYGETDNPTVEDREQVTELLEHVKQSARSETYLYTGGMTDEEMDEAIADVGKSVDIAFEGGVATFADGLTHRFPGMKKAITDRYHQKIAEGEIRPLPARTGEKPLTAPKFYPMDGLDAFFDVAGTDKTRRPLHFAGASRSSWPWLSKSSQYSMHLFVEILAKALKDEKDNFAPWTGGTKYGFEEIVHEVFYREGWHLLADLTQNTSISEQKWEPDDRIHHYAISGISWFGRARPVTDEIKRRDGIIINAAGGGIAKDQIGMQMALNANICCLAGYDASKERLDEVWQKKATGVVKAGKVAHPMLEQWLEGAEDALPERLATVRRGAENDGEALGQLAEVLGVSKGQARTIAKKLAPLTEEEKTYAAGASIEMAERYASTKKQTLDDVCEQLGMGEMLGLLKKKAKIKGEISLLDVEPLARSLGVDTASIKKRYEL